MRTLGRLVALGLVLLVPAGTAVAEEPAKRDWSSVETLSDGSDFAYSPEVVVAASGVATAVWEQDDSVWAASRPTGGSWESPVRLGRGSSPVVDADGAGNVTVAWLGAGRGVRASRLTVEDPDRGWTRPAVLARPRHNDPLHVVALAPELDVGTSGVTAVVFAYGNDQHQGWRIRAAVRAPGGRWHGSDLTPAGPAFQDPHVAVAPDGDIEVLLRKYRQLWTLRKPAGTDWHNRVVLARDTLDTDLEVGADGRTVAAWTQRVEGGGQPLYASLRAGRGWSPPVMVSTEGTRAWSPDIAIDDTGSTTIAWLRPPRAVEVVDRQPDGSWGSPVTLSDPPTGRFYDGPSLSVGAGGDAVLAWSRMERVDGSWGVLVEATRRWEGAWAPVERITPYGDGDPREVATAVSPDGSGLLVWEHWPQGGTPSVVLARWSAAASR